MLQTAYAENDLVAEQNDCLNCDAEALSLYPAVGHLQTSAPVLHTFDSNCCLAEIARR